MYAIIKTGGKQYKVAVGQTLKIEQLPLEAGDNVDFNEVLMVVDGESVKLGKPFLLNSKVTGSVVKQGRAKKIKIIKFRRRKHHMKQMGHRQNYTEVSISGIQA